MPNCGLAKVGDHFVPVKNSSSVTRGSAKNAMLSATRMMMIATVVATEMPAHTKQSEMIPDSLRRMASVRFPAPANTPGACAVPGLSATTI